MSGRSLPALLSWPRAYRQLGYEPEFSELRNGFPCSLYWAFVTWKLVLGYHRLAEGLRTRWRPL
jgi:hypothetical protein